MAVSKKRTQLEIEEEKAIIRAFTIKGMKNASSTSVKLRKEYDSLLQYAARKNPLNMKSYDFPITGAFVVFEKEKERDACLYALNKYGCLSCRNKYPSEFLFGGAIKLSVKSAPEPVSIHWENYSISFISRLIR